MGICQGIYIDKDNHANFYNCITNEYLNLEANLQKKLSSTQLLTKSSNIVNILASKDLKKPTSVYSQFIEGVSGKKTNSISIENNTLSSQNCECSYESFSSIDNTNLNTNSISVDFYQISRNIFEQINQIRQNPDLLPSYISPSLIKENNIQLHKSEVVLWSEKVYLCCSQYLIDVEEKCATLTSMQLKTSSERVSDRLKGKYICVEYNIEGLYSPNECISILLTENITSIYNILKYNYSSGAVCCFPSKESKMRTLIYLVNKIN